MIELDYPNSAEYRNTASEFYKDTYVFTSAHNRTELNRHGYCFHEDVMLKGNADRSEDFEGSPNRVLNLVSDKKKLLVEIDPNWFHYLYEQMPSIIYQIQQDSEIEVIIKTSMPPRMNTLDTSTTVLIKILSDLNIDYKIIDHHEYGVWEINNFIICKYGATTFLLNNFTDFCKRYVVDKNIKPFRKIFISRKFIKYDEKLKESDLGIEDSRIDDHEGLEDFFRDLGFEILYPENIPDFEERINLFYETDILASLTGAGMTNALFMQEGSTVLEIATPLVRSVAIAEDWKVLQEFHHSYIQLAFRKKLIYMSVPNLSRSIEDVRRIATNSRIMQKIFEVGKTP